MHFRNPFPIRIGWHAFAAFLVAAVLLTALLDPLGFAFQLAVFAALVAAAILLAFLLGAAVYIPTLLVCRLVRGESLGVAARSAFAASRVVFRRTLEFAGSINL